MPLKVPSGGAVAASSGGAASGGAAAAEAPKEEEKKEEEKVRLSEWSLSAVCSLMRWSYHTGGVRRRYGLWSVRLSVSLAKSFTYRTSRTAGGLAAMMTCLHDPFRGCRTW